MKYSIVLLAVVMLFVGSFALTVQAESDWEMTGGLAITNTTLDVWNESIDNLNDSFNNGFADGALPTSDIEEMDNIEKVPMLFLGGRKNINDKWTAEFRYEYIFGTVEGSAMSINPVTGSPEEQGGEIDVKLHGIVGLADYRINENWTVGGGIGLYNGTKTKDFYGSVITQGEKTPDYKEFDLDGISYRLGVGYEKDLTANWGFNGGIDYLYMEIDDEEEGDVDSKGFSYNLGLVYNF